MSTKDGVVYLPADPVSGPRPGDSDLIVFLDVDDIPAKDGL